ncbi:MAG TPA: hypothetical protein VFR18_21755 [Terriglobia bacterium]|nr:hypothetical protein [Terriglobia bacterium]
MWKRLAFVWLTVAASAFAQEGHPLSGTWTGDWGPARASRNHITLVMNWDGTNVVGVVNPGPNSVPIKVFVDYSNWTVRIDGEVKDDAGKPVRFEADGKLEQMGSPRRRLVGTWRQGELNGDFRVTREQ